MRLSDLKKIKICQKICQWYNCLIEDEFSITSVLWSHYNNIPTRRMLAQATVDSRLMKIEFAPLLIDRISKWYICHSCALVRSLLENQSPEDKRGVNSLRWLLGDFIKHCSDMTGNEYTRVFLTNWSTRASTDTCLIAMEHHLQNRRLFVPHPDDDNEVILNNAVFNRMKEVLDQVHGSVTQVNKLVLHASSNESLNQHEGLFTKTILDFEDATYKISQIASLLSLLLFGETRCFIPGDRTFDLTSDLGMYTCHGQKALEQICNEHRDRYMNPDRISDWIQS